MRSDLGSSCRELAVPVFMAAGRYDRIAPPEVAERYFHVLTAPRKQWLWFEDSGHFPQWEQAAEFDRLLIETVLPAVT